MAEVSQVIQDDQPDVQEEVEEVENQEPVKEQDPNETYHPKINPKSQALQRGVSDLYEWKQAAEEKREALKQQIEESTYQRDMKFITAQSQRIVEGTRENLPVEEILTKKGELAKSKIKMNEQFLYDFQRMPQVNDKTFENLDGYQKTQVYDRLHNNQLQEQFKYGKTQVTDENLSQTFKSQGLPKYCKEKFDPNTVESEKKRILDDFQKATFVLKQNSENGKKISDLTKASIAAGQFSPDKLTRDITLQQSLQNQSLQGSKKLNVYSTQQNFEENKQKNEQFKALFQKDDLKPCLSNQLYFEKKDQKEALIAQNSQILDSKTVYLDLQQELNLLNQSRQPQEQEVEQNDEVKTESPHKSLSTQQDMEKLFIKQSQWLSQKQQQLEQKRQDHEVARMNECSFKPTINKKVVQSKVQITDNHEIQKSQKKIVQSLKNESGYANKEKARKDMKK